MTLTLTTSPFDAARHLESPEDELDFLAAAIETGDRAYITHALGVVARARGMSQIASEAGVTRMALYKSLQDGGDPRLSTFLLRPASSRASPLFSAPTRPFRAARLGLQAATPFRW